ncbi:MAG TPA: hypothetical protein ENI07_15790 [Desulfobacterales bacterium]|nr:hypothetical protein [Desulfobacterales bacterium]
MAKKKFRNRSFCYLEPSLIESDAFLNLSGKAAMICLIRFHQKAYRKRTSKKKGGMKELIITNNGQIVFPYSEAVALGLKSSRTFYKVLHELVEEKGFVDVATPGNWYLKELTKYSISGRWKRYGTSDFEQVKMPRGLPEGLGFKGKARFTGVK